MSYDPNVVPDPRKWIALDEGERTIVIQQYLTEHRLAGGPMHAHILAIVEYQIAAQNPATTGETVTRLMREGLTRYEALKCVGLVVSTEIYRVMTTKKPFDAKRFGMDLKSVSAKTWRESEAERSRRAP